MLNGDGGGGGGNTVGNILFGTERDIVKKIFTFYFTVSNMLNRSICLHTGDGLATLPPPLPPQYQSQCKYPIQ